MEHVVVCSVQRCAEVCIMCGCEDMHGCAEVCIMCGCEDMHGCTEVCRAAQVCGKALLTFPGLAHPHPKNTLWHTHSDGQ
jgi:hypothetical protein